MRVVRRGRAKRAENLNVLGRIRKMIFAANHMRNFHLHVVNHIHKMENP